MANGEFEIKIECYLVMGQFIRHWATGKVSRPDTIEDLKKDYGAYITLGPGFKDTDKIQYLPAAPANTVSIVLPDASDLELPPENPYPLPDFYDAVYSKERPKIPKDKAEEFRSRRIADYAMRKCV